MMSPSWSASLTTVRRLTSTGTSVWPLCDSVLIARIIVLPSGSVSRKACATSLMGLPLAVWLLPEPLDDGEHGIHRGPTWLRGRLRCPALPRTSRRVRRRRSPAALPAAQRTSTRTPLWCRCTSESRNDDLVRSLHDGDNGLALVTDLHAARGGDKYGGQ